MDRIELILKEREELVKKREENLERIEELDAIIDEYKKSARHFSTKIFLNDRDLNNYMEGHYDDKKTSKFGLSKLLSFGYKKMKMYSLERDNLKLGDERAYYQNELGYYEEEKKALENENITIHNKIFVIDHELKKDFINVDDLALKEVNDDRHQVGKRK